MAALGSPPPVSAAAPPALPPRPVEQWMRPFVRFLEVESASGVVLLVCTWAALALANSPWSQAADHFWHTAIRLEIGPWRVEESLLHLINDGLMTIFFFVAGLEIKRELVAGELRDPRKAALPVAAALGGMLAPAAIYWVQQAGQPGARGWGIPMATDIAFVVGFLALLGQRAPLGLKIMLLSLAIADDIGAVVVIAFFYSTDVSLPMLGLGGAGLLMCWLLNRIGVRRISVYVFVGILIWLAFFHSGVHPTVAGVLLGLLTPASAWVGDRTLRNIVHDTLKRLGEERDGQVENHNKPALLRLTLAAREAVSPLERLEAALHPWVAYGIMPLFALANAGVAVNFASFGQPVGIAAGSGLFLGKPLGILLLSWLTVKLGLARLPQGVNWKAMLGAGSLAGIGFTMSLFVAKLAFNSPAQAPLLDAAKVGVLTGSALSAVVGFLLLRRYLPKAAQQEA